MTELEILELLYKYNLLDKRNTGLTNVQTQYTSIDYNQRIDSISRAVSKVPVKDIVPIRNLSDLPAPVNQAITLTTVGKLYFFVNEIDFKNNDFYPKNNSFFGVSQNSGAIYNARYVYLDSDTTIRYIQFRNTTLRFTNILQSYDWQYVNFVDCSTSIEIINADNIILDTIGFLNSAGVIISGTVSSLVLSPNCFFSNYTLTENNTYLDILSTAVITRRIRIEKSAFVVSATSTGIKIHPSATINPETFILNTVSFAGAGTYLNGVNGDSDIAKFTDCTGTGIINSTAIGGLILRNNNTATTALVEGVQKQIVGTFTGSVLDQRFNVTSGISYYTSSVTRTFKVICSFTLTANNNTIVGTYIAKVLNGDSINPVTDVIEESEMYLTANGARPDTGTIVTYLELSQGDGWYIVTENDSGTNDITYKYIHALIETTN